MSLREINRTELKAVFEALEEAFHACQIDYYLIGALARDIWYARADKKFRTTKDVDFAILIGSNKQYEEVRDYLTANKGYVISSTNAFVVIAPDKTEIDLLPFGAVAFEDKVKVAGEGLTSIRVNGFMEVYEGGTENIEVIEGHSFAVAKLPAIVMLKFIAYDDRPDQRIKDARDIANIIVHFFDLEADLIYDQHYNLFSDGQPDRDLAEISAIVIGREIYKILKSNTALCKRMIEIITGHIKRKEKSAFIRNMAQETDKSIEEMILFLKGVLLGLTETTGRTIEKED